MHSAPPWSGGRGRGAVPPRAALWHRGVREPKDSGLREAGAQDARLRGACRGGTQAESASGHAGVRAEGVCSDSLAHWNGLILEPGSALH